MPPSLPPVDHFAHLVDYAEEMGWTTPTGDAPTWADLAAWQSGTGTFLAPWEFVTLHKMMRIYAAQLSRSDDPKCPNPWKNEPADPADITDALDRQFDTLDKNPPNAAQKTR